MEILVSQTRNRIIPDYNKFNIKNESADNYQHSHFLYFQYRPKTLAKKQ